MWHNMNLCCFFSHFLYARFSRAACWGEESIFLGEIMDRPCFENGECRESQNGAAINEEKWARSGQDFQDFPVWAMGSDIYSKFQSMLRMTFIGVSAGESHMFLTFPAAFDPYQKQIFPAQRSSKLCSKVDTSYTKTFGEQKSARRTWTSSLLNADWWFGIISNMSFVPSATWILTINHWCLTLRLLKWIFSEKRVFQPLKQNHGTHWFSEPRDG